MFTVIYFCVKFMKTIFRDIGKSEKIKEHQLTEHQKRNAE